MLSISGIAFAPSSTWQQKFESIGRGERLRSKGQDRGYIAVRNENPSPFCLENVGGRDPRNYRWIIQQAVNDSALDLFALPHEVAGDGFCSGMDF